MRFSDGCGPRAASPLVERLRETGESYRGRPEREQLFEAVYERVRRNWLELREPDRWPTRPAGVPALQAGCH
jgi:hypothetical protein